MTAPTLRPLLAALAGLALLGSPPASAQAPEADGAVRVGVAAPLSGPSEILGRQVLAGAAAASGAEIVEADTGCTAEGGAEAARRIVAADADVAVGFLCSAAIEAALPILSAASIPTVDVGVRSDRLLDRREREGWRLWSVAPGPRAEAEAIAAFVARHWPAAPFGIVEDGSAYGRDLADAVREILEAGGARPAFVDNYRPAEEKQFALARRIAQSGVSRVLVFGARPDIAILARDAAEIGLALEIVGGESLVDAADGNVPLPPGVRAVASGFDVDWTPAEEASAEDGYGRAARLATALATQAVRRARASSRSVDEVLRADAFTVDGREIRFDARHHGDLVPFGVYRWTGERFEAEGGS